MDAFVKVRKPKEARSIRMKESDDSQSSLSAWESKGLPLNVPAQSSYSQEQTAYSSSSDDCCCGCSSPLSDSSGWCSCDDELEDAIGRAESQASSCYVSTSLPILGRCRRKGSSLSSTDSERSSPLLMLDSDVMAGVLGFLEPEETLEVLTMPLCKQWRQSYASEQDLWRVLCLLEPFKAKVGDESEDESSTDDSFCSFKFEPDVTTAFGEYRLMYTSFVRCRKYLNKIKDDARNGRPPSAFESGKSGFPHFGASDGLKKFLARSRSGIKTSELNASAMGVSAKPIGVSDDGTSTGQDTMKRPAESEAEHMKKKPRYGKSMITERLLGPAPNGRPSHLNLPRTCAIYSIVNWMVAFPEVEGIQTMCIEALPVLLEDEMLRLNAQRMGLVEVIIQAMLTFNESPSLHTAAFYTMVLLARPLGGREGMLFDNSKAESSSSLAFMTGRSVLASKSPAALDRRRDAKLSGANGFTILLDSMRRFDNEEDLQAKACWAMVNLALVPAQKTSLLRMGAIDAVLHAMICHPCSHEVQFRALFALINLVVLQKESKIANASQEEHARYYAENDIINSKVSQIAGLVGLAMKNFCSSVTILNRACLVLHNLTQTSTHRLCAVLWTPHLYQMVEWCITNHPTDRVLLRCAVSTLQRLQGFLASNQSAKFRFERSLKAQQEFVLQQERISRQGGGTEISLAF